MMTRRCSLRCLATSLLAIGFATAPALAFPPPNGGGGGGGGGGTTPPGTIYLQLEADSTSIDRTYQMDAAGGHVRLALPAGMYGYPSTLRYGADGHRTWLMGLEDPDQTYDFVYHADGSVETNVPHTELFAVKVTPTGTDSFNVTAVRACNSFGVFEFQAPQQTYVRGQFNGDQVDGTFDVQWSAEGLDAYAFGRGADIRNAFSVTEDGVTSLDLRYRNGASFSIVHLPTTTMTLGQAVEAGIAESTAVVDVIPGVFSQANLSAYQVSPDGSLILGGLELRDSLSGAVLWDDPNAYDEVTRWSPNGGQVAFDDNTTIWLTDLGDPRGSPYLDTPYALFSVAGSRNTYASWPRWSPTNNQVIFQQRAYKKGSYRYDILRIPVAGSDLTPINVTAGLSNRKLYPLRWCTDGIAP